MEGVLTPEIWIAVAEKTKIPELRRTTRDEPDYDKLPKDFKLERGTKLLHGTGCPNCRNTGYRGRSGLYELMVMNDEISHKIMDRAPSPQVVAVARAAGMRLLREDGWDKVCSGATTVDEVVMCTAL